MEIHLFLLIGIVVQLYQAKYQKRKLIHKALILTLALG